MQRMLIAVMRGACQAYLDTWVAIPCASAALRHVVGVFASEGAERAAQLQQAALTIQ